jgi:importin-5
MSMLPADVQGALTHLLQNLQSGDNAVRSGAENELNNEWFTNRPDVLLMGLAEQIQSGQDIQVRL